MIAPEENESDGQIDRREDPPFSRLDSSRVAVTVIEGNRINPRRSRSARNDTLDEVDVGEIDAPGDVRVARERLSAALQRCQ